MSRARLKRSKTRRGAPIPDVAFAPADNSFAVARPNIVAANRLPIAIANAAVALDAFAAALAAAFALNLAPILPPILLEIPRTRADANFLPILAARRLVSLAMTAAPALAIFIALNARFIARIPPGVSPSPARNFRTAGDKATIRPAASPLAIS